MSDFYYSVGDDDSRYGIPARVIGFPPEILDDLDDMDLEECAKECADDYDSNHDGWECRWPLKFTLYRTETSPSLGVFVVEKEAQPVFSACKISEGL